MSTYKEFLEKLRKKGWIKEHEDNHLIIFSHKKYGKAVFTSKATQKTILAGLKDMEKIYKREKNGKVD